MNHSDDEYISKARVELENFRRYRNKKIAELERQCEQISASYKKTEDSLKKKIQSLKPSDVSVKSIDISVFTNILEMLSIQRGQINILDPTKNPHKESIGLLRMSNDMVIQNIESIRDTFIYTRELQEKIEELELEIDSSESDEETEMDEQLEIENHESNNNKRRNSV